MTDLEFQAWLENPAAIRIVLVEAGVLRAGAETTVYLGTGSYTTKGADTPAHTPYLGRLSVGWKFKEELSLQPDAEGSLSAGDLEIDNRDGSLDSWLTDIWVNRSVKAYIGDPRWPRADFRLIFDGITASMSSRGREVLNLKITDKLQRLNTPLIETKLGGTTPNQDEILPVLFGEGHNITPLLVDPATLEYQVHDVAVESIFEVRDNGLPVSVTVTNSTGKFRLNQQSFGTVTVSAQGDKGDGTYRNTVSALIQRIVTSYGKASDRFVSGDLDAANLSAFETAHPQPVGAYFSDRTNVLTACRMLASSIGAQMIMSADGKLRLVQVDLPPTGTPVDIYPYHIVERSLVVADRPAVVASVKLGFNRNWTIQDNLVTTIPEQHKDLFAKEWLESVQSDSTVKTNYHLNDEPVMQETMLLTRTDADAEATRRLNLWKVQRTVYRFEATATLLNSVQLGSTVRLWNPRFGMSAGVLGLVVSREPDWSNGRVNLGVLV